MHTFAKEDVPYAFEILRWQRFRKQGSKPERVHDVSTKAAHERAKANSPGSADLDRGDAHIVEKLLGHRRIRDLDSLHEQRRIDIQLDRVGGEVRSQMCIHHGDKDPERVFFGGMHQELPSDNRQT